MGSTLFLSPSLRIPKKYVANDSRCSRRGRGLPILSKYAVSRPTAALSSPVSIGAHCIHSSAMERTLSHDAEEWTHTVRNKRHPATQPTRRSALHHGNLPQ